MLYFCEMMDCIQGPEWAEKVPVGRPIYNIGGGLDLVGNWGDSVCQTTHRTQGKDKSKFRISS